MILKLIYKGLQRILDSKKEGVFMKRYIKSTTSKNYTLVDILNDPRGRELIDSIEEAEEEIRGRGIDPNDTSEFWVRSRSQDIKALRDEFGYIWR